jgi:hypothetical protein
MVILYGIPGVGKTTHAKEYCSYITKKEENKIVRWFDSDSENKLQNGVKEIIEEIKNKEIQKIDNFDKMCHDLAYLVENKLREKNLLFVFDNLEDFELIKIFYTKFKDLDNVQILITTKDYSFRDKLSECKFADNKVDFFGLKQAEEYFEKSLQDDFKDKEAIIERVLKSETKYASSYLPHRLYNIVNYIKKYSIFDIEETLNQICDKTKWDKNDIYFEYFDKIKKENEIAMKILYFMSLMDPDKIQSYLINHFFEGEVEIHALHAAIDFLVRNGFIETFKTDNHTFFRIHRITQNVIESYRGVINNYEIENKLLSVLNKYFVCEIDFRGILSKREHNVVSHVFSLLKIPYTLFNDRNIHMELQLNYQIFCLRALDNDSKKNDHTNSIYIILQTLNKLPHEDIKLKIFNSLIYYYHYADPLFVSEFLEKAVRTIENFILIKMVMKSLSQ